MARAAKRTDYEFQRLHGMGGALYAAAGRERDVRIYAPVGAHQDLLPYLVRRLLENGANTSFVHSFLDEDVPAERIAADPYVGVERASGASRPHSLAAGDVRFASRRRIRADLILASSETTALAGGLQMQAARCTACAWKRGRWRCGGVAQGAPDPVRNVEDVAAPADAKRVVGHVDYAADGRHRSCLRSSLRLPARMECSGRPGARETSCAPWPTHWKPKRTRLIAILAREGGKTFDDGIAEVREAVDFCRYYASEAETKFAGLAGAARPCRRDQRPGDDGARSICLHQSRGISRWRSSPARSPARWLRATRCWPSPLNRRH